MFFKLFTLLSLFGLSTGARAQENCDVLPKGVFRARLVSVFTTGINEKFTADGDRRGLLDPLNRTLSATQLAGLSAKAGDPSLAQLVNSLNVVEPGLGRDLFSVDITANATIYQQRIMPTLEYGITNQLAAGIFFPINRMEAFSNFAATVHSNSNDPALLAKIHGLTALENGVRSFDTIAGSKLSTQAFASQMLIAKGYQVPSNFTVVGLGDIEGGVKYQYFTNDWTHLALVGGFRLPTTSHPAVQSNLLDQGLGLKQLDFMVQLIQELRPLHNLVFGTSASVTFQVPDTQHMAVRAPGEDLADLTKPNDYDDVRRHLGELLETEVSATYHFWGERMNIYSVYQYKLKGQDMYSGTKSLDYASLMQDTKTQQHRFEVGLGYSTISQYLAKSFSVPLEAYIRFNTPISAANVPNVSYARLDFYFYF